MASHVSPHHVQVFYPDPPANKKEVGTLSDFPDPVAGVITLADNTTYKIYGTVDLLGARLVGGQNTCLLGGSSENSRLKSTGLTGTALITSEWSLPIRGITIEADVALALDADGNSNQALDWFGVNFTDCPTVGTIANYNNAIMTDCALLNSSGLTFDGSVGTIGFLSCLFDGQSGTILTIPATATISRRLRIAYCSFVAAGGETAIDFSTSASVPTEGYILDTVNFSGGGTYTAGVQYDDNKAKFLECVGITNSARVGLMYMNGNVTATTVNDPATPVKAAGTTTAGDINQKFSHDNNKLTCTSAIPAVYRVTASASLTSGNNHQIGLYIAKNDSVIASSEQYVTTNGSGRAENVFVQTAVELSNTDYVEIYVENNTMATDITVTDLSVLANLL